MLACLDLQHDGQTYKRQRDPPGQKSLYIAPGNNSEEKYRLGTFYKFPTEEIPVDPISLAQCGFFFTGYKDRVKCYSCGINAENWVLGDDPSSSKWHYENCLHMVHQDARNVPRNSILNLSDPFFMNTFFSSPTVDLTKYRTYIPPGDCFSEKYRLATFSKFPARFVEAPVLAMNGFMYTGDKSKVKCYSCGSSAQSLPPYDSGNVKYHKANCEHINGMDTRNEPLSSMPSFRKVSKKPTQSDTMAMETQDLEINNDITKQPNNHMQQATHQRETPPPPSSSSGENIYQTAVPLRLGKKVNLGRVESDAHRKFLSELDLHKEADRKKSFVSAPGSAPSTLAAVGFDKLAATGFFFLGDTDRTQCFSCNGILRRWDGADSPYFEHLTNFPACKMVKGTDTSNHPSWSLGTGEGMPEPAGPSESVKATLLQQYKCEDPKSPHMKGYEDRLRSFIGRWPMEDVKATPEQIAKAGFFCIGDRDKAKCWYCNGGLQNWDYEDEPWTEHAKWFPGCEFVLQQKGPGFVAPIIQGSGNVTRPAIQNGVPLASIIQAFAQQQPPPPSPSRQMSAGALLMSANIGPSRPPSTSELRFNPSANSGGDVVPSKKSKQEEFNVLATKARELGFSDVVISSAMIKKESFTFAELLDILLAESEKKKTPITKENTEKVQEKPRVNMKVKENRTPASTPAAPAISDEMKNKLAKMELERMCKLCKQNPADHLVLPCGHIVFCQSCSAKKPERCALCKRKVDNLIKTFTA